MGTPDFAAESLKALINAGYEVVGAVSQPDKPKGRGHKLMPTEVKVTAQNEGIALYQPETLKGGALMPVLEELKPDLIAVAAYGRILPEYVLNYPRYGCVNVHASLLPKYRGAAPIQWAVINGDKITGVTTMLMAKGLDTGDMLLKADTEIGENETAGELFDRLAKIGGELLVKTAEGLEKGEITPIPQNDAEATYAPMISRETGDIDWTKSPEEICALIRGVNPWPLARTAYMGETLKIAEAVTAEGVGKCGEILSLDKGKGLRVAAANGAVYIKTAQFPQSKRMNVEDYARGHEIKIGTILG